MSNTIYPVFSNMLPTSEDVQLIMDSLMDQIRLRLTKDFIFTPGICSGKQEYIMRGTNNNTIKILPFIGYNINGDRIQNELILDNLSPATSGQIVINEDNIIRDKIDTPYWRHYSSDWTNLQNSYTNKFSYQIATLNPGSVLQGIKLYLNQTFASSDDNFTGNIYISIGIENDLEKYYPITQVNINQSNIEIGTANLTFSENQTEKTPILITFYSESGNDLSTLISGSLLIDLLISDLSNTSSNIEQEDSGQQLGVYNNYWQVSTTYFIVARHKKTYFDTRQGFVINDQDISITSEPFDARYQDSVEFFALRKSGSIIDPTYDTDIKLGEVITDSSGNFFGNKVYSNGYDGINKRYWTDYLTLNFDKMPLVLDEYASKLYQTKNIILEDTEHNVKITLNNNTDVYEYTPTQDPNLISINVENLQIPSNNFITFELVINMSEELYTINAEKFDQNIKWLDNTVPTFDTIGVYYITFRSRDNGNNWIANFEGKELINT